MIVFSIDIKKIVFRTDTKIKIQCSCFLVKCFVVNSVKEDQVITEDGETFRKVQVKCWKICNHWRRFAMLPWSVRILRGSERTRWFWPLWVPLQGHVPDWWQEYVLWIHPHERSNFKIHDILGLSGVQWGIYSEWKKLWRFPEDL